MDVEIKMPDLATATDEVTIVRWLIEPGQAVKLGQPLLEIETDKATMDVESIASGTLKSVYAQAGELVAVGQRIAIVESETAVAQPIVSRVAPSHPIEMETVVAPPVSAQRVSLFARNKAARNRTVEETIPLSGIQREVAKRVTASKQTIPHFYLTTSANAERIVSLRGEARIVWDAFFVLATARAMRDYVRVQYHFDGERLVRGNGAIGVAADVDDDLYVVPIEQPLSLTLAQISERITSTVERIRAGDAAAKRLGSASMTITNLGAEGIESFQAIINPPEAAILAIGKIAPMVFAENNAIMIQKRVSLSLSVDHRVVNGKYAAAFLSRIVKELKLFQA